MKKSIRSVFSFAFVFPAAFALTASALVSFSGGVSEARAECPCQTSAVTAGKETIPQPSQAQDAVSKKKAANVSAVAADDQKN